ncbi:hypothetical protein [Neorhizobium sp. T6_25]|uniref:hypothetical protein n=1 Tax=Neorhizobium sp. T6_25 TaxID=2093833 RepID=UPI00155E7C52|nr:hypothetical protein [Neorhizobium sp. T6_25]
MLVNTDVLGPAECKEKVGAKFARPFSLSTLLSGEGKIADLYRPATMMMKESIRQDEHELGETVALDVAAPPAASGVAHPFLLRSFGA